jgi:hypothetical protein
MKNGEGGRRMQNEEVVEFVAYYMKLFLDRFSLIGQM